MTTPLPGQATAGPELADLVDRLEMARADADRWTRSRGWLRGPFPADLQAEMNAAEGALADALGLSDYPGELDRCHGEDCDVWSAGVWVYECSDHGHYCSESCATAVPRACRLGCR